MGGSAQSETEEGTTPGVGAGNMGAPATLGSFAPTVCNEKQKRRTVIHLDQLIPYQRSATDVRTYGKGSGVAWRKNGKEGETSRRCYKHSSRIRRNGPTPVIYAGRIVIKKDAM